MEMSDYSKDNANTTSVCAMQQIADNCNNVQFNEDLQRWILQAYKMFIDLLC